MQFYGYRYRNDLKTFLFFFLVLIISYLPVSSFLFFIKNDAFNGYFPSKFFISESLNDGYLPLWNPYINYGLPQYSDMNSGFWSPITWLIAFTTGYNAYSFTIELLIYILLSGIGMNFMCMKLGLERKISLLAGVSYMCSGYMVGHLQHFNWISGAAFLPFSVAYLNVLNKKLSTKNLLLAGIFLYLLIASSHPGILIGAFYFFIAFLAYLYFLKIPKVGLKKYSTDFIKKYAALLLIVIILSTGLILGYSEIIPFFTRGEKIADPYNLHFLRIQNAISLLLPFSVMKNDAFFISDLSMRNLYIGLPFLVFFLYALVQKKSKLQKFLLYAGLFYVLISFHSPISRFINSSIPLFGYIRLKGEFVIFIIFGFNLLSAIELNKYVHSSDPLPNKLKIIWYLVSAFLIAITFWAVITILNTHSSVIYKLDKISSLDSTSLKLKYFVDNISFHDTIIIQGSIQIFIILLLGKSLLQRNTTLLFRIIVLDLVLATLLNVPFTGVGKASVAEVQTVLNKSPKGIVIPPLVISKADTISENETGLVGNWSFYNKTIGPEKKAFYPVELYTSAKIFNPVNNLNDRPLAFCTSVKGCDEIIIKEFTGNKITIDIRSADKDTLVYRQSYYPNWVIIKNDKKEAPLKFKEAFLATEVHPGKTHLTFKFVPTHIKAGMLICAISLLISFIIILAKRRHKLKGEPFET